MFKFIPALFSIACRITNDSYTLSLDQSGTCSAAKTCHVVVEAAPRGDMHINTAYPTRFKIADNQPISYGNQTVDKDGGIVTENLVRLRIPFIPNTSGDIAFGGTFYFSVCNGSACHLERVNLSTLVQVQ